MSNESNIYSDIRVFTLNCYGLRFISPYRSVRMAAIGDELVESDYDIVLLQEVWMDRDYRLLKEIMSSKFPYSHHFDIGIIGSGTCIFTKVPIEFATFHEFAMNGYPQNLFHGDWFAAKGLGVCQIELYGFNIHIYTSHYHAEYNPDRDVYIGHRCIHALESAQWINLSSSSADLTIYAGDFNSEPKTIPYRMLKYITPLTDAWTEVNGTADSGSTSETIYNSFTPESVKRACPEGKRIDYILYQPGVNVGAEALECNLPLSHRIPGKNFSYSDHEAVAAKIRIWKKKEAFQRPMEFRRELSFNCRTECVKVVKEAHSVLERSSKQVKMDRIRYFTAAAFWAFLLLGSFVPLFFLPSNYHLTLDVILFIPRFISTIFFIFFLLMATLFNKKELNALNCSKACLTIILEQDRCGKVSDIGNDVAEIAQNFLKS